MTDHDLAELRGELFALKALLTPCLHFLAAHYDDPAVFLDRLNQHVVEGATQAAPNLVTPNYQAEFVRAAVGWAGTLIEGARKQQSGPKPRLQ
jgi:hypothetical protein